jgi:hypothetical protein
MVQIPSGSCDPVGRMLQIGIGYGGRRFKLRHRPSSDEAQILLIVRPVNKEK